MNTKASGTNTMWVKRTRAPAFTCLKLLKAKRLIISAPANAVTKNATMSPGKTDVVSIAREPYQGGDDGRRRGARQALEVVLVLGRRARVEARQTQRRGRGIEKTHQPSHPAP